MDKTTKWSTFVAALFFSAIVLAAQKDVFFRVNASNTTPCVKEQVIYTIELFVRGAVKTGSIDTPDVVNAIVRQLGQQTSIATQIDGKDYQVIKNRYLILPQHAGKLVIHGSLFVGKITSDSDNHKNSGRLYSLSGLASRDVKLRAESVTLNVKPLPAGISLEDWLPAKQLYLTEYWEPNPPAFQVGKTVYRVITLKVVGQMADQLPMFSNLDSVGLSIYSSKPDLKSYASDGSVIALYSQKIAIEPVEAGRIVIPAVKIKWWDTTLNKMQLAELSARAINVLPSIQKTEQQSKQLAAPLPSEQFQEIPSVQQRPISLAMSRWFLLILLLIAIWIMGILVWGFYRHRLFKKTRLAELGSVHQYAVQLARDVIKESCMNNDILGAKQAIIRWAEIYWPERLFLGLANVADAMSDAQLRQAIENLDKIIRSGEISSWNGSQFWDVFADANLI